MARRTIAVGIFVIVGFSLFVAGLVLIGNQRQAFAPRLEFYTEFTDVGGLSKGARVLIDGFEAGELQGITIPAGPPGRFRLKLSIERRLTGLVRRDSVVSIATEGVVGDKLLSVSHGTAEAGRAAPSSTLLSKEPLDIAEIMATGAGFLKETRGNMNVLAAKLGRDLDTVNTTVTNVNDLALGLKQGRGTAGMLLHDERTAQQVREVVSNAKETTATLTRTARRADALAADFQSRQFPQTVADTLDRARSAATKVDVAMDGGQDAVRNIDEVSRQLKQTVAEATSAGSNGLNAGENVRQSLSNTNQATGNVLEESEALKRSFLFRGYFKKRGYYDMATLTQAEYRSEKIFSASANERRWLSAADLFQTTADGVQALSEEGKNRLNILIGQLISMAIEDPIVIEGYSDAPDPGLRQVQSQERALSTKIYLQNHFHLDPQDMGTVALGNAPITTSGKQIWNGICIVFLKKR